MERSITELQAYVVARYRELGRKEAAEAAERAWSDGREIILPAPSILTKTEAHALEAFVALANLQSTRNI